MTPIPKKLHHWFKSYKVTKLPSYQIIKLTSYQATKLPNYQVTKLPSWNPPIPGRLADGRRPLEKNYTDLADSVKTWPRCALAWSAGLNLWDMFLIYIDIYGPPNIDGGFMTLWHSDVNTFDFNSKNVCGWNAY